MEEALRVGRMSLCDLDPVIKRFRHQLGVLPTQVFQLDHTVSLTERLVQLAITLRKLPRVAHATVSQEVVRNHKIVDLPSTL